MVETIVVVLIVRFKVLIVMIVGRTIKPLRILITCFGPYLYIPPASQGEKGLETRQINHFSFFRNNNYFLLNVVNNNKIEQLNLLILLLTLNLLRSTLTKRTIVVLRSKVSICVSEGGVELRSSKRSVEISILVETSLPVSFEAIVLGSVSETILVEVSGSIIRYVEGTMVVEVSRSIDRSVEGARIVEVSKSIVRYIKGTRVVEVSRSIVRAIKGTKVSRNIVRSIEGTRVVEVSRSIVKSIEGNRIDEVSRSIVRSVRSIEGTRVVKVEVALRTIRIEAIVLGSISEAVLVEVFSSLGSKIGTVEGSCIVLRPKALCPSEHGVSFRLSLGVG